MKPLSAYPDAHLRLFERPPVPAPDALASIYLIGICGTGMGALAGLFQQAGYRVSGSDKAAYPPMSIRLAEMGIRVEEGFDPAHLVPPPDLTVVGNACTPTHPEAAHAREHHLPQQSLPEALAHFFIRDRRSLVVAGTHGKTTTTGMLTHVLQHAGLDPGFFVGGVLVGSNSSCSRGSGPHFVVEGDEYDSAYFDKRPKFLHYRPTCAIVTSMEFDHADIYEDWADYQAAFQAFSRTVDPHGLLVLHADEGPVEALAEHATAPVRTYGLAHADLTATDVRHGEGGQRFTLVVDGTPATEVFLPMSGRHNRLNALAVSAVALHEGVSPDVLAAGLATFQGMKRRQEVRGEADGVLVVDDFAHHPTAVRETIAAVAERWPSRRLIAVFEPRSNSSRRKVFETAYGDAFDRAAQAFLSAPPLRHNDVATDFMDVDRVLDRIRAHAVPAAAFPHAESLLPALVQTVRPGDVVLIMSNGSFGGLHSRLLEALTRRAAGR